jgi:L-glyceraldehyde 3-phosphate reductase
MQIQPRPQVGLKLPEISLGLWHNFGGTVPLERSREIVRRSFELGITHFTSRTTTARPRRFGRIRR